MMDQPCEQGVSNIEHYVSCLKKVLEKSWEKPDLEKLYMDIDSANKLSKQNQQTLEQILKPIFTSIPQLCFKLSKNIVKVSLEGGQIRISNNKAPLIEDVMNHVINNSLSHGIEDNQTRLSKDKNVAGEIIITAYRKADILNIEVEDK